MKTNKNIISAMILQCGACLFIPCPNDTRLAGSVTETTLIKIAQAEDLSK